MSKTIYTEIVNPNGNFLFTVEQLNNTKTNDKCLPCKCVHCGEIFHISKQNYINTIGNNPRAYCKFCSKECFANYKRDHSITITKPCLLCGKLVTKPHCEANNHPNFFCCRSHAATYNNSHRSPRSNESRAKTSATLKAQRHKRPPKPCKVCGQSQCSRPDICNIGFLRQKSHNLQKLGFDMASIGTTCVYDEWNKLCSYMTDQYINQQLSSTEIANNHQITDTKMIWSLLQTMSIPIRSRQESSQIALLKRSSKQVEIKSSNYKYKHGWHTNWLGKTFYYRSSYELDYCLELDKQKVEYEMEQMQFNYWDSTVQSIRIARPDFFLPQTNTIVEIKSTFTYKRQEMVDKSLQYKKLGYNFKLILNHQEYDYCPDIGDHQTIYSHKQ